MGSPDFAIPALDQLHQENQVLAVYTQPPRPAGRGMQEQLVPVARHAQSLGLPVRWPTTLRDAETQTELAAFKADVFIVVAYGLLLPKPVLALPRYGCINGHASLLPRWRGAAPIQRAILAGDAETGMSAMLMQEGLDTGPVLATRACAIAAEETAGSLHDTLAQINAALLAQVVAGLPDNLTTAKPQDAAATTYAAKITTDEAAIDWMAPLSHADRQIRAFSPFPGAWFAGPKGRIKIIAARPLFDMVADGEAGSYLGQGPDGQMRIALPDGVLEVSQLQPAGKRQMPARDFLNGQPLPLGYRFGPVQTGQSG